MRAISLHFEPLIRDLFSKIISVTRKDEWNFLYIHSLAARFICAGVILRAMVTCGSVQNLNSPEAHLDRCSIVSVFKFLVNPFT
ncbi:hypothetical protein D3C87_1967650 [compost metagenome]